MSESELQRALRNGGRFGEFSGAFKSGETFGDLVVERRGAGQLVVTSNTIVACDPYGLGFGVQAFDRKVPRGRFPVVLSVAHVLRGKGKGEERIACAMVQLGRTKAVGFRRAEADGLASTAFLGATYDGYEVESGTGCFADGRAARLLDKACKRAHEAGDLDPVGNRTLREKLSKHYEPARSWAAMKVERESGANLVAFTSGYGDGCYPSYWGYDAERRLVCLVTDFLVLPTLTDLCRDAWSGQAWRRFHYQGDRRDRFWRIKVKGPRQTVQAGLVGDDGLEREKEFATSDAAMQSAMKKIRKQTQLGFHEVSLASSRIRTAKSRRSLKQEEAKAKAVPKAKAKPMPKAKPAPKAKANAAPKAKAAPNAKAKPKPKEAPKAKEASKAKAKAKAKTASKSSAQASAKSARLKAKAPAPRKRRLS